MNPYDQASPPRKVLCAEVGLIGILRVANWGLRNQQTQFARLEINDLCEFPRKSEPFHLCVKTDYSMALCFVGTGLPL